MDKNEQEAGGLNSNKDQGISLFNTNDSLSFIHKKSEKISCAIYLVTNHLSDKEPLKWEIRNEGLSLIKDTILLANNFSDNLWLSEKFGRRITAIISFLDLLTNSGFISKMNHSVLKVEITKLASFLEVKSNTINYTGSRLEDGFFDIPPPAVEGDRATIGLTPGFDDGQLLSKESPTEFLKDIFKGQMSFKDKQNVLNQKPKSFGGGSDRKQKIIAYIKSKKEVGVKDIASVVKGYSEKTLQRDLVSLVKAGVLKKRGERRWSTYYMA